MVKIFKNRYSNYAKLGEILEKKGLLSRVQAKEILHKAEHDDRDAVALLLQEFSHCIDVTLETVADVFGIPIVRLREKVITPRVLHMLPREIAEKYSVIVFKKNQDVVHVATTAVDYDQIADFIAKKTGLKPVIFFTTPNDIKHALLRYKTDLGEEFANIIDQGTQEAIATGAAVEQLSQYVPIINMVNTIIERGLLREASDIHIQPYSTKVVIRYRIDGVLYNIAELPVNIFPALLARLKIISNLKIDTHQTPQDSRFSYRISDREVAIRVSIVPTLHGSKIVLRLLDMEQGNFTLRKLGLNRKDFDIVRREARQPHGMILVTGPTGSGKTTTLYTLLHILNREGVNICTIEDPVEYGIDGVNQTQINTRAGVTFANGLKSLLRQDPDILMVGEIRDEDTAAIAVNAAMTGHMVLSTLHTNNAFMTPERLVEMNVPAYLVASVVNLIISQRLVRRVCPHCRIKSRSFQKIIAIHDKYLGITETFQKLQRLALLPPGITALDQVEYSYGKGCSKCNQSGYSGRIGIYEIVKIDEELQLAIINKKSPEQLKASALKLGALTIIEDGILKALSGKTTFEEVLRVTKG